MRKIWAFVFFVLVIVGAAYFYRTNFESSQVDSGESEIQEVVQLGESPKEDYIFIPYWTIDEDISASPFQNLIYFGIEGTMNGINTSDDGYRNLEKFKNLATKKKTFLVVRLVNQEVSSDVLKSKNAQEKIVSDSVKIAKEYGFTGVILDLETQGLPFDSLITRITDFNKAFEKESKESSLSFGTLVYGDVYYRLRPYDVKALGEAADRVFIMAYDFSKSRGNPGPNFPLNGKDIYGYDFAEMVKDVKSEVPVSKLTIILGMFGYDWTVDENGKSVTSGTALTTLQAERFMTRCITNNSCKTEKTTSGQKVTYTEGDSHVLWFETDDSTNKKIEYLKSQGINSIGFWAYGFF